jgi:hypothetical protein
MAGRYLRTGSITVYRAVLVVEALMGVSEFRSLDNTAVNQEVETEESVVMSECECSNSHGTFTTEVSVGMSTRQLQDILTNIIISVRTDSVTLMETILHSKYNIPI